MNDEPRAQGRYTLCPGCGGRVAIDGATAVGAVRPVDTGPNLKQSVGEQADGLGALFHAECFEAAGPGWKRA